MPRLYLYAVFHANLNFSYIPEDLYPQILQRCYWPLLKVIENQRVPLGLEFSGYTLQMLEHLDSTFIDCLRDLWQQELCEVIGSGYVQSIMPLVPARVNRENLRIGNDIYRQFLGRCPTTAYLNELVYSAGLPPLYREAGYEAIIVNWESALPVHDNPELLYRPCTVPSGDDTQLPIIWHSVDTYRDFQRYIEKEVSLDTYLTNLSSYIPEDGHRALPLYSSDWEIFDFKPWRVQPEGFDQPDLGEMRRISDLLDLLNRRDDMEFVLPSRLLSLFPDPPLVNPESSAFPLPYKKQAQHPVTRWSVGGRDGVRFNTQCHQLYQKLLLADWCLRQETDSEGLQAESSLLWRDLVFLWNSDFRTFTTEDKHLEFRNRMGAALSRGDRLLETLYPNGLGPGQVRFINSSATPSADEPVSFNSVSNGVDLEGIQGYEVELLGQNVPCQVTNRIFNHDGTSRLKLEAMPSLAAAQTGTGTVYKPARSRCQKAQGFSIDQQSHTVETTSVRLELMPSFGGIVKSLTFPQVFSEPLLSRDSAGDDQTGTLTQTSSPGDVIVIDWLGRSMNDAAPVVPQYPDPNQNYEIFFPIRCHLDTELGTIWKTYRVYLNQPRVDLTLRFQWRDMVPRLFRVGCMELNSDSFDRETLYYATTNGGVDAERFRLEGQQVRHDEGPRDNVSASGCLGATEGWVVLGDAAKGLGFVTKPAVLYSVPMLHYQETRDDPGGYSLTLTHSLAEKDEASHILWRGHSTWSLSILAGHKGIVEKTRSSAFLANGGLVAQSGSGPVK